MGIVVYLGDDTGENKLRERLAGHRAPTAGIVAAPAMMGTTGQIDGIAYPETVGDSLGVNIDDVKWFHYLCFTRSRSSACLAEFHDSRLPVR